MTNHTKDDNWDDFPGTDEWSTEEYQGSLADTKVFTPSIAPSGLDTVAEQTSPINTIQDPTFGKDQLGQNLQLGQHGIQRSSQSPVPPMVGSLTAAQTQYFSQVSNHINKIRKYLIKCVIYYSYLFLLRKIIMISINKNY